MTADWLPMSMRLQSEKEFMTTARVLPRRIWKMGRLYLCHQSSQTVAWSAPRERRWPKRGMALGISGMPLI